jgi:ABC-type oligopeptide transport system substrate-binding subunit
LYPHGHASAPIFGENMPRWVAVAFVCGGLCAAACRSTPTDGYGTATPQHALDTLWVNNGGEPESLDPALCAESVGGELVGNLFAGLVDTAPDDLHPVPDVATSWQIAADRLRYTFALRPTGWSDGTPVVAADFVYSWRRLLDPNTAARNASMLYVLQNGEAYALQWPYLAAATASTALATAVAQRVPGSHLLAEPQGRGVFLVPPGPAEALPQQRAALMAVAYDDGNGHRQRPTPTPSALVGVVAHGTHTLEVVLERPVPYFLSLLAYTALRPVPGHVMHRLRAAGIDPTLWTRPEHIVSNGAYRLSGWRFKRDMTLTRNAHYWDAAHVALTHVQVLQIENAQTALNLYRTGALDWLGANTSLPAAYLNDLATYKDYHQDPLLSVYFYWMNTAVPPLDNVHLRRALSLAIDRGALVRRIVRGGQQPTADLVPDAVGGYRGLHLPQYDVVEARRCLAAAGYARGADVPPIALAYNTADSHRQIAETIQAMWQTNLGITVRLENQEWRVFLQNVVQRDFQIARMGWVADYPDANSFLHDVLSQAAGNNVSGWQDATFEALLLQANASGDAEQRLALLRQAEARALAAQPLLPLYVSTYATLVKPYVRGFVGNYLNRHAYKHLSLVPTSAPTQPTATGEQR